MTLRFSEAVSIWLSQQKDSTALSYERRIKRCLNLIGMDLPLREITVKDIDRYSRNVKKYTFERNGQTLHYSPRTISEEFNTVKIFFKWCLDKRFIDQSPADILKAPSGSRSSSREKAMSDEDLQTLISYSQNSPREHALIRLQSEAACRTGELVSLRIRNCSLTEPHKIKHPVSGDLVDVYTAKVTGKTGERVVGFYSTAAQAIRLWLLRRPKTVKDNDYVFITNRGKPFTVRYVNTIMKRLAKKIEDDWGYTLENTNIYSMRHRMGHNMGDSNTPLPLISTKLGHKSVLSTMHYLPDDSETAWVQASGTVIQPQKPEQKEIIDLSRFLQQYNG